MPILFVGHGSPMNAIEDNEFARGFKDIAKTLNKPRAILCISAHWETRGTFVTAMDTPETIHDFGGFPLSLYKIQYPAPGSPDLAERIKSLIKSVNVESDYRWGLDHGTWSVLRHIYPEADIPVVQMSIDYLQTPQYHYDLIKESGPLRDEGILIIGSGNMVHNLRLMDYSGNRSDNYAYAWALEANNKMKKYILNDEHKKLINYRCHGKAFELAIPTPEHFLPLLYILALKEENENIVLFNDKIVAGSVSMTSLKIG